MSTGNTAHAGQSRDRWCDGTGRQVDDPFAVWPWTGDPL